MEKLSRPQRNRRHSRRAWPPEDDLHQPRPTKRLFTPEIKRMLKDWLVRRRENPYPSRDEKKRLAFETGLTYTQICNWFANWRRKLKNSERERVKRSWGHLIKHYNTNAKGNVEQFSISSEDSIWEEEHGAMYASDMESREAGSSGTEYEKLISPQHQYYQIPGNPNFYVEVQALQAADYTEVDVEVRQHKVHKPMHAHHRSELRYEADQQSDYDIQSNSNTNTNTQFAENTFTTNKAKYKQKMMEKYLREEHLGAQAEQQNELSKWLESAAKFTPDKSNYYIEWNGKRSKLEQKYCTGQTPQRAVASHTDPTPVQVVTAGNVHHKDELDAAEALANLAFNCRQRIMDRSVPMMHTPINASS